MVHDIIMNSLDRPEIVMSQDVLDAMREPPPVDV